MGVTSQKKLWSSFVMFEGSCNHDEVAAVQEGTRRLEEMFYFVGVAEVVLYHAIAGFFIYHQRFFFFLSLLSIMTLCFYVLL